MNGFIVGYVGNIYYPIFKVCMVFDENISSNVQSLSKFRSDQVFVFYFLCCIPFLIIYNSFLSVHYDGPCPSLEFSHLLGR